MYRRPGQTATGARVDHWLGNATKKEVMDSVTQRYFSNKVFTVLRENLLESLPRCTPGHQIAHERKCWGKFKLSGCSASATVSHRLTTVEISSIDRFHNEVRVRQNPVEQEEGKSSSSSGYKSTILIGEIRKDESHNSNDPQPITLPEIPIQTVPQHRRDFSRA